MELHYFPTASYILAQCVHYHPEAFTSTITLDPLKTVCNARLNLSTALNLNSNHLIVITYASLLQTVICASTVKTKLWFYKKYQLQKFELSPKMSTGIMWIPLSSQEKPQQFIKIKGCFANIFFSLWPHALQSKPH